MVSDNKDYFDEKTIGLSIRKRREELGITQEALAFASGVTSSFLSIVEQGKKYPSVAVLKRILYALNVNVSFEEKNGLKPEIEKLIKVYDEEINVLRQTKKGLFKLRNDIT